MALRADDIQTRLEGWRRAVSERDWATAASYYAEDCVLESALYGKHFGRAGVEDVFRRFWTSFPDAETQFQDPIVAGDQFVQTLVMVGTDTGGFLGQAPTGRAFRAFMVLLCSIDEAGHIAHERRVYDRTGVFQQLATESDTERPDEVYRAALARARLDHDVAIAAQIQRALLPERQHTGQGFEIAAASEPCRTTGGDFIDYFDLPDGALAFVLGDVAGKGPPAALLAAQLQGILASQSSFEGTPAEILARANHVLLRRRVDARFATLVYGVLSKDGRLTYCNAGHNPPLLVGPQGVRRLEAGGLPLGAFEDAAYDEETVSLEPGDLLVIFSDGLSEAEDASGTEFGDRRLLACVKSNRGLPVNALLDYLLRTVSEFTAGTTPSDDRTVLVLRYTAS